MYIHKQGSKGSRKPNKHPSLPGDKGPIPSNRKRKGVMPVAHHQERKL